MCHRQRVATDASLTGWGAVFREKGSQRTLARRLRCTSHQRSGIEGSLPSPSPLSSLPTQSPRLGEDRQCGRSFLHKQTGRVRLPPSLQDGASVGALGVASRQNAHCPLFFSLGRDSPPLGMDAMAHPWPPSCLLYAFPPFSLLQPLLQRVWTEEVRVVLVAPLWPHMTWFSDIPPLLDGNPWKLPVRRDLLSQGQGTLFHSFPKG